MINKLDSYDVILLSRYVKGGGDQRSKMRILSSKIINFICRLFWEVILKTTPVVFL